MRCRPDGWFCFFIRGCRPAAQPRKPAACMTASTAATGLKATVDSSVFLGLNTHYFAHTDDGDKIEIIQESQIDSIIPDGTVVRLGVKTEKINVFDAEGKQNLLEGVRNDNAV